MRPGPSYRKELLVTGTLAGMMDFATAGFSCCRLPVPALGFVGARDSARLLIKAPNMKRFNRPNGWCLQISLQFMDYGIQAPAVSGFMHRASSWRNSGVVGILADLGVRCFLKTWGVRIQGSGNPWEPAAEKRPCLMLQPVTTVVVEACVFLHMFFHCCLQPSLSDVSHKRASRLWFVRLV